MIRSVAQTVAPLLLAWLVGAVPEVRPAEQAPEKPSAEQIRKLVRQLESEKFQEREEASARLEAMGELALPALEAALKGNLPLEPRRRLEMIIARIQQTLQERIAKRLLAEIDSGGLDRFLELMVARKELDSEASWKAVVGLATVLVEKASKLADAPVKVPALDYAKFPTEKEPKEASYEQVRMLVPGMTKVSVLADSIVVSSKSIHSLTSLTNSIVFVNGDFGGCTRMSNCVIVCTGNIGDITALDQCLVIATGSTGRITSATGCFFQVKATGEFTSCDDNCFVNQKAVDAVGARNNRFIQTERGPLQSLKFFDVAMLGLSVLRDGATLESVREGTPFAGAGLQAGDRLLTVDQFNIATAEDLRRALRGKSTGDRCAVSIRRGEQVLKLKVQF